MPGNERMVSQILARVQEGLLLVASSKHDFGILSHHTQLPTYRQASRTGSVIPNPQAHPPLLSAAFVVSLPKANW